MAKRLVRKIRLTDFQNRLLWMLEEAGSEVLGCIFNTLRPSSAEALEREIRPLLRLGWVSFYKDLGRKGLSYVRLDDEEVARLPSLAEMMVYDEGGGNWRRTPEPNAAIIEGLMLNDVARKNWQRGEPH